MSMASGIARAMMDRTMANPMSSSSLDYNRSMRSNDGSPLGHDHRLTLSHHYRLSFHHYWPSLSHNWHTLFNDGNMVIHQRRAMITDDRSRSNDVDARNGNTTMTSGKIKIQTQVQAIIIKDFVNRIDGNTSWDAGVSDWNRLGMSWKVVIGRKEGPWWREPSSKTECVEQVDVSIGYFQPAHGSGWNRSTLSPDWARNR